MELIGLIVLLWLIGCAFPGSGGGAYFEWAMIPVVIVCGALLLAVGAGTMYAAMGVTVLLDGGIGTFMLSWVAVIMALGFANKTVCDWIDRRKAFRLVRS